MKKFICLLLLSIVCVVTVSAVVLKDPMGYDFEIRKYNGETGAFITEISPELIAQAKAAGIIQVPEELSDENSNTYSVIGIGMGVYHDDDYFENLKDVVKIVFPKHLKCIDSMNFAGMPTLREIVFNDKVDMIDDFSFGGCPNLEFVDLPESLTFIGVAVMSYSKISDIDFSNLCTVSEGAFSNCHNITKIYLNKIRDTYGSAFEKCSNVTEITFGPDAIFISGFNNLASLETVRFAKRERNFITFGDFTDCPKLKNVHVENPLPFTLGDERYFPKFDTKFLTLYVPEGAVDAYRKDAFWGSFGNIVEEKGNASVEDVANSCRANVQYFVDNSTLIVKASVATPIENHTIGGNAIFSGEIGASNEFAQDLPAGIYLIKTPETTMKVAVK